MKAITVDTDLPKKGMPHATTRCNTLQHAATRCNTLQHAATHCNTHLKLHISDGATIIGV